MYAVAAAPQAKSGYTVNRTRKSARISYVETGCNDRGADCADSGRLRAGRAARSLRRADGSDAGADQARRQEAAAHCAADVQLAGGSADRRRLRCHAGNIGRQPGRVRSGAAFHGRGDERRDQDEGRDLPGAACRLAGLRERRAVHAAARADRLGRLEVSRRLEGDRQPVRRRRPDRVAARDQAGRCAVSRADGRPAWQCLDRAHPRACRPWRMPRRRRSLPSRRFTTAI